ncbi:hypothetical protein K438DRAFT_1876010, partial [Mycena galopus ATCC 62051]
MWKLGERRARLVNRAVRPERSRCRARAQSRVVKTSKAKGREAIEGNKEQENPAASQSVHEPDAHMGP